MLVQELDSKELLSDAELVAIANRDLAAEPDEASVRRAEVHQRERHLMRVRAVGAVRATLDALALDPLAVDADGRVPTG